MRRLEEQINLSLHDLQAWFYLTCRSCAQDTRLYWITSSKFTGKPNTPWISSWRPWSMELHHGPSEYVLCICCWESYSGLLQQVRIQLYSWILIPATNTPIQSHILILDTHCRSNSLPNFLVRVQVWYCMSMDQMSQHKTDLWSTTSFSVFGIITLPKTSPHIYTWSCLCDAARKPLRDGQLVKILCPGRQMLGNTQIPTLVSCKHNAQIIRSWLLYLLAALNAARGMRSLMRIEESEILLTTARHHHLYFLMRWGEPQWPKLWTSFFLKLLKICLNRSSVVNDHGPWICLPMNLSWTGPVDSLELYWPQHAKKMLYNFKAECRNYEGSSDTVHTLNGFLGNLPPAQTASGSLQCPENMTAVGYSAKSACFSLADLKVILLLLHLTVPVLSSFLLKTSVWTNLYKSSPTEG